MDYEEKKRIAQAQIESIINAGAPNVKLNIIDNLIIIFIKKNIYKLFLQNHK